MIRLSLASAAELIEGHSMRLTFGHQGDWVVDPRELAARLGVSADDLKRLERDGCVEARIKAGSDENPEFTRVTVRLLNRGWRGTFDQSGTLVHEEVW
ncbi:DUF6522 family protein [Methylobacterium sp. P31]